MYNISHTIANNGSSDNGNGNDWFIGSTKQVLRDAHTKRIKKRKSISVERNRWTSASNVDCVMVNERETMALQHKTRHHKNRPSQLFSRRKESSGQVASTNKCFYSNSLCVICLWTVHVDGYIPSSRMTAAENRNERFIAFAILWKEY